MHVSLPVGLKKKSGVMGYLRFHVGEALELKDEDAKKLLELDSFNFELVEAPKPAEKPAKKVSVRTSKTKSPPKAKKEEKPVDAEQ